MALNISYKTHYGTISLFPDYSSLGSPQGMKGIPFLNGEFRSNPFLIRNEALSGDIVKFVVGQHVSE